MKKFYMTAVVIVCLLSAFLLTSCGMDQSSEIVLEEAGEADCAEETTGSDESSETGEFTENAENAGTIFVHICGEVKKPGVYELPEGSRVYELLQRADGFTDEACARYINQAELLSDGEQIYVPSSDETEGTDYAAAPQQELTGKSGLININTATQEELTSISGIGTSRATDIISYRQEHGKFTKIEDIMQVPGIKEGLFGKIKDQITV